MSRDPVLQERTREVHQQMNMVEDFGHDAGSLLDLHAWHLLPD